MTLSYPTMTRSVGREWYMPLVGLIIPSPVLSRASCKPCKQVDMKWGRLPTILQIRLYRFSRNVSSLGDGRHFLRGAGLSPARFQKASRTSRFICRLVVM